jgi:sRNA-binding regulator protein Hfq
MSISPTLPSISDEIRFQLAPSTGNRVRRTRKGPMPALIPYAHADFAIDGTAQRQAELFYLQKQIHTQTPMVIVLEDGEHVEGCIEWYDRNSIKVRGRVKCLVYKSAIKYMYKVGEGG